MRRIVAVVGVLTLSGCAGCESGLVEKEVAPVALVGMQAADDEGSCAGCHPRQYREWAGSSHNYGGGLDPVYQSLEMLANYYASHRSPDERPALRQNSLCAGCHSPSLVSHADGLTNPNASFRLASEDNQPFARDLARPEAGEHLLAPVSRATEDIQVEGDPALAARLRRIAYQGITCDACHKAGAPFDDLEEDDTRVNDLVCRQDTLQCAEQLFEACETEDDPRCRRISRAGDPHREPEFERGIANMALKVEREGSIRYGPFPPEEMFPNPAHDFGLGATEEARGMTVSFPGEDPPDVRPFLATSQFCGACHDVRLPSPGGQEPVHEEPFQRLENLYTEWYRSPLNLHPESDLSLNPYRDENGNPRRIVCQDCHMSLFPYAPPGVFPGEYTAGTCNDQGECGELLFVDGTADKPATNSSLRATPKARVTTHNMTGPDIGLGQLPPARDLLGLADDAPMPASFTLPNQTGDAVDPDYGLPSSLDARREQLLKHSASISLAGTPEFVDVADRDCSDGSCCDDAGHCNLPIKAWLTNVNGGHNVAAGFSQERQMWVELTVQDMGNINPATGLAKVVDCALGDINDLYRGESLVDGRYPRFERPVPHDAVSANDVIDRMFGIATSSSSADHESICRGLSGHLIDKPHHETGELVADGLLDDEDVWLHRIGNTLPELSDGKLLVSWHVMDFGLQNDAAAEPDSSRVGRNDQFHVVGNDAFTCELSSKKPEGSLDSAHPLLVLDPVTGETSTVANGHLDANPLKWRVTDTSDERLEILYPFPEFGPLLPSIDNGTLHGGERFGLVYPTNIFYRVCGCPPDQGPESCEGAYDVEGPNTIAGVTGVKAQMPWVTTFPVLPIDSNMTNDNRFHFPLSGARQLYQPLLDNIGLSAGTRSSEAFTFVPLNANHMPNNRALKFYKPQRHYWDIRFDQGDVVGPIRVSVKLWFRHFPPEFLRLMSRASKLAYTRALGLGTAEEFFPHGPLVVEGEADRARWPMVGDVDKVRRLLVDEAVFYVGVNAAQAQGDMRLTVPDAPTFSQDVAPILQDHCLPCHSDVLRHGNLVLDYDDFARWDDPARGEKKHAAQDGRQNLLGRSSGSPKPLVTPGDTSQSFLLDVLEMDTPSDKVRRMPLFTDQISARERQTIRRWIETGAP